MPLAFADPRRRGRGRPRLTDAQRRARGSPVPRVPRPVLDPHKPLHVTLRALWAVPSMRTRGRFRRVRDALRAGAERFGMRVVHFAVMDDHVHLIVEAEDKASLARGMQGLTVRVAKAVNRGERQGKVFRDRYHAVVLENPRQVRHTIRYVLLNARRHQRRMGRVGPARWIDPCSSGVWFDGWSVDVAALVRETERRFGAPGERAVAAPRTWLLGVGWRRARLIDPSEVPGH